MHAGCNIYCTCTGGCMHSDLINPITEVTALTLPLFFHAIFSLSRLHCCRGNLYVHIHGNYVPYLIQS